MERCDSIAESIEQFGRQTAGRRDGVEEIVARHARHAQHPVDRRTFLCVADAECTVRAAHDWHDVAIEIGRRDTVQFQFAHGEAPALLSRGEVEE